MRALLNILAIIAIAGAAYGTGKLNHMLRFTKPPTEAEPERKKLDWVKPDWYMNKDGEKFRDANGKITQARGCKNELGIIVNGNTKILDPSALVNPPAAPDPATSATPEDKGESK